MDEPLRILSDLHLGHRISRITEVNSLRPLIAGARTVVFNGDTWQELARSLRDRSQEMLEQLRELCREEGATPIFLAGNHDPGWQGCGWLELAGGKILITHGDGLLFAGSPWKREILGNDCTLMRLWNEFPDAAWDPHQRLELARKIAYELHTLKHPSGKSLIHRAWDALTPPTRALRIIEAWRTQGEAGSAFCDRYFPQAEVLIIGHFHWDGSWRSGGRRIINTGSFVAPGRAQWVDWNDGWLSHGRIFKSNEIYQKAAPLAVWRVGKP
jgi:predicted phosphodiesterase